MNIPSGFKGTKYFLQLKNAENLLHANLNHYFLAVRPHEYDLALKDVEGALAALYKIKQSLVYFRAVDQQDAGSTEPRPPSGAI